MKLLETNYRHVNIALVNEMAVLCHDLGVDLWDVIRCAETKPFGFQAFRPGPGVGGHGVPQDLHDHTGRTGRTAAHGRNSPSRSTARCPSTSSSARATLLNEHGKSARGARVLLLGVTYKPDLADQQGSPAQEIAIRLMELGASVSYHDPHIPSLERPGPPPPARGLPLRGRGRRRPDDPAPAAPHVRPPGPVGEGTAAAGHPGGDSYGGGASVVKGGACESPSLGGRWRGGARVGTVQGRWSPPQGSLRQAPGWFTSVRP